MQHENIHVKKGISDLKQEGKGPNQKRIEKLLPLVLILIPLLVLGIFMLNDEQNKATSLPQQISEQHEDDIEQGQTWEEYLIERWEGKTFGDIVRELSISQYGEPYYYNNLLGITRASDITASKALTYHRVDEGSLLLNIYLVQDWNPKLDEVLGNWLNVDGADVDWDGVRTNTNAFMIRLTNLQDEVTISISGLPNIVLTESEPLTYTLVNNYWDAPAYLTPYQPLTGSQFEDYGMRERSNLIISTETEYIDVQFSDLMVTAEDIGKQWEHLKGEWLDVDTYRIYPNSAHLFQISFDGLLSLNGRHTMGHIKSINVIKKPASEWINITTGQKLKLSKQAVLYDAIVVSPNGKNTVGIDEKWAEFGPWSYYSLFLDQGSREPLVLADRIYSNIRMQGYPVTWISNEAFLYFSYNKVHLYNIVERNERILYQTESNKYLLSAGYEQSNGKLHLYVRDEYQNIQSPTIDYIVYDVKEQKVLETHSSFSQIAGQDVFHSSSFTVLAHKLGIFLSKLDSAEEKITLWKKPDGTDQILLGHVEYSFEQGILLQDSKLNDELLLHTDAWWLDTNGMLMEFEMIPETYFQRIGDHLIRSNYNGEKMVMELFNQYNKVWVELDLEDRGSLPFRNYAHPFIKEEYSNLPFIRELISKSK